jgi:hypothetical protein
MKLVAGVLLLVLAIIMPAMLEYAKWHIDAEWLVKKDANGLPFCWREGIVVTWILAMFAVVICGIGLLVSAGCPNKERPRSQDGE